MNLDRLSKSQRVGAYLIAAIVIGYLGYAGKRALTPTRDVQLVEAGNQSFSNPGEIIVQVGGAVKKPGVFKFKAGARVLDAINAASGATKEADLEAINQAKFLEDGAMIIVPRKLAGGAAAPVESQPQINSLYGSAPAKSSGKETPVGTISLNSAPQEELEKLPGVGPATAAKIIQYRQARGGFKTIDEIKEVSGIGEKKFAAMRPFLAL